MEVRVVLFKAFGDTSFENICLDLVNGEIVDMSEGLDRLFF
jgi:hypothetical protein